MKFVDLTYPPEALAARVRGFIVLGLVLDDQGRVTSADVLSGAPLRAAPPAANAREWVFEPQSAGSTVLVYRFDIDSGRCNEDARSLFRLQSPTLATVTACTGPGRPPVTPWPSDDLQVLVMPRVEYPQIARSAQVHGTVVVRLSIAANGTVAAATPLAGVPLLTEAALNNARTWKFAATAPRETIVVYEFAFMERLRADPPCATMTLNEIVYPRFIRISVPSPCVQVSTEASREIRLD
jgi:TonB family protein